MFDFAGLHERQQLEKFVKGPETAGKNCDGPRAEQEMHFTQREIVELETQFRRYINIGCLFMRQNDVQSDCVCTNILRTAIGGFHYRWAAA